MVEEKNQWLLANFFIVYSILQGTFVFGWSIFVGIFGVFLFLLSGMAHGHEADTKRWIPFIGIAIVVSFAIVSTPIIFKAGRALANNRELPPKRLIVTAILSVIGILLNGTAFALTVLYFVSSQSN
jgi:uncharacterized BrkB/YihY/UPF0761 family membrane protein